MKNQHQQPEKQTRRGVITLLAVVGMVVTMGCIALVLDQIWLDMASTEMTAGVEAPALAAAKLLASDDFLKSKPFQKKDNNFKKARRVAGDIAAQNRVAGRPLYLDTSPQGDIRFGNLTRDAATGVVQFLETTNSPTSVLVTGQRTRKRNNPVALFLQGISGTPVGDVVVQSTATIDNRIIGIRPNKRFAVPALPMAILKSSADPKQTETWEIQIEQRLGRDLYSYDTKTNKVILKADGIPEIILRSVPLGTDPQTTNVVLLDLNNNLRDDKIISQIQKGWRTEDMKRLNGELRFDRGLVPMKASCVVASPVARGLAAMIGQPRICPLYINHTSYGKQGQGKVQLAGLVAGRVMSVKAISGTETEIIFQPTLLTTRTALLPNNRLTNSNDEQNNRTIKNRYIYKLYLTH